MLPETPLNTALVMRLLLLKYCSIKSANAKSQHSVDISLATALQLETPLKV